MKPMDTDMGHDSWSTTAVSGGRLLKKKKSAPSRLVPTDTAMEITKQNLLKLTLENAGNRSPVYGSWVYSSSKRPPSSAVAGDGHVIATHPKKSVKSALDQGHTMMENPKRRPIMLKLAMKTSTAERQLRAKPDEEEGRLIRESSDVDEEEEDQRMEDYGSGSPVVTAGKRKAQSSAKFKAQGTPGPTSTKRKPSTPDRARVKKPRLRSSAATGDSDEGHDRFEPPSRLLSAYEIFLHEQLDNICKELDRVRNGGRKSNIGGSGRFISERWQAMTGAEKAKYFEAVAEKHKKQKDAEEAIRLAKGDEKRRKAGGA